MVKDVAQYILNKTGKITMIQLHRLCYYAQAWHLVWEDKPLFNERIEAWIGGAIIPAIYNKHYEIEHIEGNPDNLTEEQKQTIDKVLDFYTQYTNQELNYSIIMEEPYKLARKGLRSNERGNHEITLASMEEYYGGLDGNIYFKK